MLKKLASLFLSLLLCLALLPGRTGAFDLPEAGNPPAQIEESDIGMPEEQESSIMPAWADPEPDTDGVEHPII